MKSKRFGLSFVLLGAMLLASCKPNPMYSIGDTGPAGGIIFNREYSTTWDYMEAAPADRGTTKWGIDGVVTTAKGSALWDGKPNTEKIFALWGSTGGTAAYECSILDLGGHDDWYLPSYDELMLMYTELKVKGLGGFQDIDYWCSTDPSGALDGGATGINFYGGTQFWALKSAWKDYRPVRYFSD